MKNIKCPHCDGCFSKYGIKNHIAIVHEGDIRRVSHKVKRGSCWNKGLTKFKDERIKKMSEKISKALKGKFGRKHSEKTKIKISENRIKFLKENPNKVPYMINHSSKMSYPEKIFKDALEKEKISGWKYNLRVGIYQYDFAFLNEKIDVEIDGATHETEKVKKIDARRDEFSIKHGWTVIRFSAKEVKNNLSGCINKLNKLLQDKKN